MKIAQALSQIKDLKGKVSALQSRIMSGSTFQRVVADQKVPSIEDMLDEYVQLNKELRTLKSRLMRTNVLHGLHEKIHEMEMLRSIISQLDHLTGLEQEAVRLERVDYDGPAQPFTTYATFNVTELKIALDENRARIRELDMELQQSNWAIDLED